MLSQHHIDLIKSTVPVLRENGVALTDYFYKRMLGNHPQLKETFNMGHQRSGAQAKALAGAVLAYAEHIEDPSVLAPVVELICHKHVSLNIQASDYAIVGENLLHSISEVLNIPMQHELIEAWGLAYQQLADLFIEIEQKIYLEHQAIEGGWIGWREFSIVKKIKESEEITSFYLVPKDAGDLPEYKAGQYVTVRVFVPELGIKQPRQYSLSDCASGQYLRISVKREDAKIEGQDPGYVSSTLHQHLNEHDVVELSAPTGNFFLVNPEKTNVLISAGVGLTPMVAMLNQLLTENTDPSAKLSFWQKLKAQFSHAPEKPAIHFIHAARSSRVHAMKNTIQGLAQQHDHLNLFVAYEHPEQQDKLGHDYHAQGHLDLSKLDQKWLPEQADYYLCGPMPFMQAQYQALVARGIPQAHIHTEAFGTGGVSL